MLWDANANILHCGDFLGNPDNRLRTPINYKQAWADFSVAESIGCILEMPGLTGHVGVASALPKAADGQFILPAGSSGGALMDAHSKTAAQLRQRLDHPVGDIDGHVVGGEVKAFPR